MSGNVGALSGPQRSPPAPPFKTVILWFRRDLRVSDNPALIAAVQAATNVVRELAAQHVCLLRFSICLFVRGTEELLYIVVPNVYASRDAE